MSLQQRHIIRFTYLGRLHEIDDSLVAHTEPHPTIPNGHYLQLVDGRQFTAKGVEVVTIIERANP
ncbi:hypothetical protein PHA77_01845 [Edwardsiella tarda]|uniref:hypothetical protein n=1 Tax=Edwardsiella tarda TaxID=636 RepID=UPI0024438610|nr:hypothetical protein [Edwardsiella tarda]WGE29435.1 hypothetical protein PHA77_01845 [Edwardsiella tarda]